MFTFLDVDLALFSMEVYSRLNLYFGSFQSTILQCNISKMVQEIECKKVNIPALSLCQYIEASLENFLGVVFSVVLTYIHRRCWIFWGEG